MAVELTKDCVERSDSNETFGGVNSGGVNSGGVNSDGVNSDGDEGAIANFPVVKEYIDTPEENRIKPSQAINVYQVHMILPNFDKERDYYGIWMIFRNYDKLDETWDMIVEAMKNNKLNGCNLAVSTTPFYAPSSSGPGPQTTAVICVYTGEHNIDEIGVKLVELVKHTIKYKTVAAAREYKYVHAGSGKVTIKTIYYYNNGSFSFDMKEGLQCVYSPNSRARCEDKWHSNVVNCPGISTEVSDHGRWILYLEYEELTSLWHYFKKRIEEDKERLGILRMECPPKYELTSPLEKPIFYMYTTEDFINKVGCELIHILEQDIVYEFKSRHPHFITLFWNDGNPGYKAKSEGSDTTHPEKTNPSNYNAKHRSADPGNNDHDPWLYARNGKETVDRSCGEWRIFKHFDDINDTWKIIAEAIQSNKLEGCPLAKCSTLYYQPSCFGPGPVTESVICVTSKAQMFEAVGLQLAAMVKQDIKYVIYDSRKCKFTSRMLYYNQGKPLFQCLGIPCPGISPNKLDIWHVNTATCPETGNKESDYGHWILTLEHKDLTRLWHILKEKIESGNIEAKRIVCPSKLDKHSPSEKPTFLLYTTRSEMKVAGNKLAQVIHQDIVYEYRQGRPPFVTLFWNEGKPDFEKNWKERHYQKLEKSHRLALK